MEKPKGVSYVTIPDKKTQESVKKVIELLNRQNSKPGEGIELDISKEVLSFFNLPCDNDVTVEFQPVHGRKRYRVRLHVRK